MSNQHQSADARGAQPTPAITSKVIGGFTAAVLALTLAFGSVRPWEGRELRAYYDIVRVLTICYGHTGADVRPGQVETPAGCDTMLARDVIVHGNGLATCLRRPVPPQVFAAFVSFTFNVGVRGACRSRAVASLNAGNFRAGCAGLSSWVFAGGRRVQGLVNRRAAERRLCESGL